MLLDNTIRLTEILIGFAFIQQSVEHLVGSIYERRLFLIRIIFSVLLIIGVQPLWVSSALLVIGLISLRRFYGPYNGGADKMSLLILSCLVLAHLANTPFWKEMAFSYLALQLVLSYFISGWVKIRNPEWRSGQALIDVFQFSAYPVSEEHRKWAARPQVLFIMSWAVMIFELLFPFALITSTSLILALVIAACFHLANAFLFGLNRFFWIWITAYPSILWFQQRIFS
ncbi:MAG: HTTM domain-containing protein [Woeseiaceae bacterium]